MTRSAQRRVPCRLLPGRSPEGSARAVLWAPGRLPPSCPAAPSLSLAPTEPGRDLAVKGEARSQPHRAPAPSQCLPRPTRVRQAAPHSIWTHRRNGPCSVAAGGGVPPERSKNIWEHFCLPSTWSEASPWTYSAYAGVVIRAQRGGSCPTQRASVPKRNPTSTKVVETSKTQNVYSSPSWLRPNHLSMIQTALPGAARTELHS